MIRQHAAGIYNWLPLGLKVLKNIEEIVRLNMDAAGFTEILMPCVQSSELWKESKRYDSYGQEMLRFKDRHEHELLFGPTNEEVITDIARHSIQSYRELPKILYQIQWKFRDEIRPRFGVMRGREFLMKDAYSIDIDKASALKTYDHILITYMRTFKDLGLKALPLKADTGEIGGDLSHEFHVLADTGESTLYYDKKFDIIAENLPDEIASIKEIYAVTEEKYDASTCPIAEKDLAVRKGIEVGHIFNFGDKYSKIMNAVVDNGKGQLAPYQMGSYGMGISRIAAAIIEVNHDDKGIIWPISVAPFKVVVINLNVKDELCNNVARAIYNQFCQLKIDVLYDDTSERPGSKFATNDLIGTPWQIIVGPKKVKDKIVELKHRGSGEVEEVAPDIAVKEVIGSLNVK